MNIAWGESNGLQVGLLNLRDQGKGAQIGLVNIAYDERVVPIGMLNFIKGGLFHPAVYYESTDMMNVSLKSGNKWFYSLLRFGTNNYNPKDWESGNTDNSIFAAGLGIGAELSIGKHFFIGADISSVNYCDINFFKEDFANSSAAHSLEARLSLGAKLFRHLGIFGGAAYRYNFLSDTTWAAENNLGGWTFFGGLQF
jgi:hypothetical protein